MPGLWIDLVYHEALGQLVLVNGGPERGKPASDPVKLWGWDGAGWILLAADPDGPRWRNGAAVAYDAARGALVLLGGAQPFKVPAPEMWLWDGATWTEYSGDLPAGPGCGGLTYDAAHERLVLFGGNDPQFNLLSDTWEWDGTTWTLVTDAGPAPRFPGGLTYDAGRGETLLFGGHSPSANGEYQDWNDTWGWDGTAWHAYTPAEPIPSLRPATEMVYDPRHENVVLFGGVPSGNSRTALGDTWLWDGAAWTALDVLGPAPREWHAMADDPGREVVMLFGGYRAPAYLGTPPLTDTWEWDGAAWRCVAGCDG